jgi:peptide chain release factor 1
MVDLQKLQEIEKRFEELSARLCDPEVLARPEEYTRINKERASLEEVAGKAAELRSVLAQLEANRAGLAGETDPEMKALYQAEIESLESRRQKLEQEVTLLLLPRDPWAGRNVIVEVRPAAGGEEAALFAEELVRMYLKYAERKGWKTELLYRNETELGGVKEVVFSVSGQNVYQHLKHESGVHRVQRVPATEAQGRIHTSTVTVAVLPEAEEVEVEINEKDLRIDTYRSQGAGGQHVNKTESAVRITHLPTNTVVACQDERSQRQNREKAMRMLRARLLEMERRRQEQELAGSRRAQVGTGERSEKIRTYNFRENRVTDHRIGLTMHNLPEVLEGDLDAFVQALMVREQQERLEKVGQA